MSKEYIFTQSSFVKHRLILIASIMVAVSALCFFTFRLKTVRDNTQKGDILSTGATITIDQGNN